MENAIECTLGSLRALYTVTGAEASVVHPAAVPVSGPDARRPAAGRPGPGPRRDRGRPGGAPHTRGPLPLAPDALRAARDPAGGRPGDGRGRRAGGVHRASPALVAGCATRTRRSGYLRTAVVNGSRSVLRRRRTARAYTPPHTADARSAESLAMLSAEHQAVVSALGRLPRRQREVLVLRYYGGLSEAEIAGALGIRPGTVKSTANRGMTSISKIVREGP